MKPEEIREGLAYYTRDGDHLIARLVTKIFDRNGIKRVAYRLGLSGSLDCELPLEDFADMVEGEYL